MNIYDCAIIGAGPAGLTAALLLARARRSVALLDDGTNRNQVSQAAHGFITRDGFAPAEIRKLALQEVLAFDTVDFYQATIVHIERESWNQFGIFQLMSSKEEVFRAKKVLLAAGVHEIFPEIPFIRSYYGKSLFSCPYCDGWENRDKPLVIIAENQKHVHHLTKLLYQWSKDLLVTTNGQPMSDEMVQELEAKGIKVCNERIHSIHGEKGYLEGIEFEGGTYIKREAGFISPTLVRPQPFLEQIGCGLKEDGKVKTDDLGRTSIYGAYSAGEYSHQGPTSIMIAAAEGNKAAGAIHYDLADESF
ncbi:NAD(P)/FAD-dependent oxidoreductase [Alkalihalobacillus pseudalcaliphilus]|uniref:NAD(P)/FAD-dependent oxidoreductase n=1 Tax=Alkalihalobacillus pseudalcaliphilus TaxID=79884 RepID=UPI00064E0A46|nr:NAD(P)/FAD-dependent oxidoreductase [Alkalihalobacillus pseudalcaliphilus]KMK75897.1 thioredoxin reductase [Alkalihalobacillus pseudalcaliphilus]